MLKPIKDLYIGDMFIHAADTYIVMGEEFHNGHNKAVRVVMCTSCGTDQLQTKDVTIIVQHTGTSMNALRYQENPMNSLPKKQ